MLCERITPPSNIPIISSSHCNNTNTCMFIDHPVNLYYIEWTIMMCKVCKIHNFFGTENFLESNDNTLSYLFWSKSTNQQPKGFLLTCLLYVYRCESYTLCKYNKQGSEQGGPSLKFLDPKNLKRGNEGNEWNIGS